LAIRPPVGSTAEEPTMYDPTTGRWISVAPLGFEAEDANLYRYVGNNPTTATDPSGLLEVDDNPKNPNIAKLRDVNTLMEFIVNKAVLKGMTEFPDDPAKGVAAVYAALATEDVFQRIAFERELQALLDRGAERFGQRTDVLRKKGQSDYAIPLKQSRYGKVPITPPKKGETIPYDKVPYAWQDPLTAGFAFTPVVKVSGVPIGLDKWGHFFQQGYWLFKASLDADIMDKGFRDQFST
jgi:uncharacterized protein RhaS with RHS repeats